MNRLKQLVVVTFLAAMACTGLYAQSVDMRAIIPFDFQAGNTLMPAGEYAIHGQGSWILVSRVSGGKPAAGFFTNGAIGKDSTRPARLEFHRYGSASFLTAVWNPYSSDGREVPQSKREKELAKQYGVPSGGQVVLASNNK